MLKGECSRCGNCCTIGDFKCTNLLLAGKLGTACASLCAVYEKRYPDMPIIMRDSFGNTMAAFCLHNTAAEEFELTKLIIEKKCSLEVA